jgi:chromosome partitioning protein
VTNASSGTSASRTSGSSKGASSAASKPKPRTTPKAKPRPVVPDSPGTARIIAIANQKGGVGKSTTAVSLGAALADLGFRVLVVDLDPQGNASTGMGIRHEAREITVYDVVVAEAHVSDAIVPTPVEHLHAIPSTIDLAGAEIELVSQFSREHRLKKALAEVGEGVYDFILLDCPPSLGLLTVNALTAAEELIVPIQCEYYALEGLGQLLRNVSLVQQNINPGLRLSGIVMTMFDPRTKLSEQVVEEVQRYFGELVYDVIIPRTVRLSEAPGYGQPITVYDPKSKGAECYRELAREVALRPPPDEPMPIFDDLPTVVVPAVNDTVVRPPMDEADLEEVPTVHAVMEEAAEEEILEVATTQEVEDEFEVEMIQGEVTGAVEDAIEAAELDEGPEPMPDDVEAAQVAETSQLVAEETEPRELEESPSLAETIGDTVAATVADDDDVWEEVDEPATTQPRVSPPRSPAPPGHLPERRVVVIDEDAADYVTPSEPAGPQASRGGAEAEPHPAVADIGATLEDDDEPPKRRWRLFRKGGE